MKSFGGPNREQTGVRAAIHPFNARYRFGELLGRGGMGEVFRGTQTGALGFEKTVVLKTLLPELAALPDFVDMFVHEAHVAASLTHPNVVQVYDLTMTPGGELAMVMENIAGLDFATLIAACRRNQRELFLPIALYAIYEVAKGLEYAHQKCDDRNQPMGLVHRDVSPQNILVSWEGDVKITDFGIAKARRALGKTSARANDDETERKIHGKFSYMSPEQARGEELDATSDLFSLGTVLYEAITSTQPFMAPSDAETLRRVAACEYPPLALIRQDLPDAVVRVVHRAMAKTPAERFRTAGEFAEALHPLLPSERSIKKALASVLQYANATGALQSLSGEDGHITPTEVASRRKSSTMRVQR